ncbi:hypothetical protein SAMD00020551_2889 [Mesobacillus selenatarsenatis SF-1]|uniref:Uncharacterized protein n=1 Tax=Mesobacillus selenatarsenatis (strain DSM 18680 / JCM 14380 / FERM P-15431 / SF-1) TaxID=1321606 RepID=A0A0A8X422_MESS1|nr:hypothetical protein SAMD00020551_2889 [Mesobacillus selenatarsenatis SF-1]
MKRRGGSRTARGKRSAWNENQQPRLTELINKKIGEYSPIFSQKL